MGHTWRENGSLGKMGHTRKNVSHLEKWVTLGKYVTIGKMGDSK